MADSSIGRTPDFGSGGSRFEPWSASQESPAQSWAPGKTEAQLRAGLQSFLVGRRGENDRQCPRLGLPVISRSELADTCAVPCCTSWRAEQWSDSERDGRDAKQATGNGGRDMRCALRRRLRLCVVVERSDSVDGSRRASHTYLHGDHLDHPAPPDAPPCPTRALGVSLFHPGAAGGSWSVDIVVTNMTQSACTVAGWPTVLGTVSNGQSDQSAHSAYSLSTAPQPKAPPKVWLMSGSSAIAQLGGSDNGPPTCTLSFERFTISLPASGPENSWSFPAFNQWLGANPSACFGLGVSYFEPAATFPQHYSD